MKYIGQAGGIIDERTALMVAAGNGNTEIVRFLIPYEAKIQNNYENMALIDFAENEHLEAAGFSIPHKAKMQSNVGQTALMISAQSGHFDIVELLIPYEVRMQRTDGRTALMLAASCYQPEIAKLLLSHEAGMKDKDNKTATIAVTELYRPECLDLLLESDAEREASGITTVALAAYRGDIRELVARRNEWRTKCIDLTVLDFALLGKQRRAIRLLTSPQVAREFFAQEIVSRIAGNSTEAACFLSCHEPLAWDFLPIVCTAEAGTRSELFALSLAEYVDISHRLRPVCTTNASAIVRRFYWCGDEARLTQALRQLKHVGLSSGGAAAMHLVVCSGRFALEYLGGNVLKIKQDELARREAQRHLQSDKQVAWRETEAESAFNRTLLLESRDLARDASAASRPTQTCNANQIGQKLARNRLLLLAFARSMRDIVQEMLDE